MGRVKVFLKDGCYKCPSAKEVGAILKKEGLEVLYYDLDTVDGLAEASFYGVLSTPTLIVEDREERPLADFRGIVPTPQRVKEILLENSSI